MQFKITTNKLCREVGATISDIMDKMYAIEDNLSSIITTLDTHYPNKVLKEDNLELLADSISLIEVCLECANDEFIMHFKEEDEDDLIIEVVTKEIAKSNDLDYVNIENGYSKEDIKSYKIGERLSSYFKLGESEFYYKFI